MKNTLMTAALLFASLGARAQLEMLGPLGTQIQSKTINEENGGVTAAVGVGSDHKSVDLVLADVSSPFVAHMAPASAPDRPLKPAEGLAPKKAKKKKKKALKDTKEKLRYVDEKKSWEAKP